MTGPLAKLKVLDLTQGIAGPFCTMELGDLGADVVKVEPLGGDFSRGFGPPFVQGESLPFLAVNRSKRSVEIDWARAEGVAVIHRLALNADVLVESFGPGEADRLGLGYEALRAVNPRLIYTSLSPFGQNGPYRDWVSSDIVSQAMSGFTKFFGIPGEPPVAMGGDQASMFAGKYLFHGIMAAVLCRELRGISQRVDMSLLQGLVGQPMAYTGASFQLTQEEAAKVAMGRRPNVGVGGALPTKDMAVDFTFLSSGYITSEVGWTNFLRDIGAPEMADDPRFNTQSGRGANAQEFRSQLQSHLVTKTAAEVLEVCRKHGGMAAAYHTLEAMVTHPHTIANDMVLSVEHPLLGQLKMIGMPSWFHGTPAKVVLPPPTLGQHTIEVLAENGFKHAEIERLVTEFAI